MAAFLKAFRHADRPQLADCDFKRLLTGEVSGHSISGPEGDTREHFWRPKAVCSMRRLTAAEGDHCPPRARNRVLASATAVSRMGRSTASASSARARTWRSRSGDTSVPSLLNVSI